MADDQGRSRRAGPGPAGLPNIGPKSAAILARVGVRTLADLVALGSIAVFRRAKLEAPRTVSLNLLWALEGAILGQPWQVVAREHRTRLLLTLDDVVRHEDAPGEPGAPRASRAPRAPRRPPR